MTLQRSWEAVAAMIGVSGLVDAESEFERHDALAATSYAGTSEAQRTIIGERVLGLPKG